MSTIPILSQNKPPITPAEIAEMSFRVLAQQDPLAAFELYAGALRVIALGAPFPELIVHSEETDDGTESFFLDPYNGIRTRIVVVDEAVRWTYADHDADFEKKEFYVCYDGHGDYETAFYMSEASDAPVSLPEGWEEVNRW